MLGDQPEFADAARAARLDVVAAQGADEIGADQPEEDACGQQAQGNSGQDGMRHHVAEGGHVAASERVQPVDPGWCLEPGEGKFAGGFRPACHGQPAQPHGEGQLQQQPGKEYGCGVAENGKDAQYRVRCVVPAVGGDHPEWDAHQKRDDERVDGKFERGRTIGCQHLSDLAVVREGGAEIAGHQLAQVFEVLDGERPVVSGVVDPLLQLVREAGGRPWRP